MDLQLLLTVVRWLLALTVIGGALWFLAGLVRRSQLRRNRIGGKIHQSTVASLKSEVDSRVASQESPC